MALGVSTALFGHTALSKQEEAFSLENLITQLEEVTVVGSQIKGADVAGNLPVTVFDSDDVTLSGVVTGDELLRSIPQMGAVNFNESTTIGMNAARGDVNSVNLRGLGTGNTLVLINGRRMVLHPGTQVENSVPVVTTNANTIPVHGVSQVEVLRDGAAALYGTDAVAGVINYRLRDNLDGGDINVRYGSSVGTALDEVTVNASQGFTFNDGKTYLGVLGTYYHRNGFHSSERQYSRNNDLRPLVADDPEFAGNNAFFNASIRSAWAEVNYGDKVGRNTVRPINFINDEGVTLDDSSCSYQLGGNLCFDPGGTDRAQRHNRNELRQLSPDAERANVFAFFSHELTADVELYSELGYYAAEVNRIREPAGNLSAGQFTVPADYYWNPLGPVTFNDGRLNPNRVVAADDKLVPEEGLPFTLLGYRATDVGPRRINVEDSSYRALVGLKGDWDDWSWDSALLYSEAETVDTTHNRMSRTAFQEALTDQANAYNIFNGGNINAPRSLTDTTPNPQSVIDPFLISVTRANETSLALADFKVSNPALFSLPSGDVGIAMGIEWRRESFREDRDARSDGTITFTDAVSGELIDRSDIVGSSPALDADGNREVRSFYTELLVPVLRDLPLVNSLDMQLSARYEHFSDVGDVSEPKVALSWYPVDTFQIRAAYSEGFRAPNLAQINATSVVQYSTYDPITNERLPITEVRQSNPHLDPESSENFTYGLVWTPTDNLTFTLDHWSIRQHGLIGIESTQNQLQLDALLREQGQYNPNVVRDAVSLEIVEISDQYMNLQPREVQGIDVSAAYDLDLDAIGSFTFKFNGAYLNKFDQERSSHLQPLIDAGAVSVTTGSLIKRGGRPRWRANASTMWQNNQWGAGLFVNYVGDVTDNLRRGSRFPVDEFITVNSNVSYQFDQGISLRLGMNNMLDEEPPLADEQMGYMGSLHSNRGRYVYMTLGMAFD